MAEFTKDYRGALISLRRKLHSFPETAHEEKVTADTIADFMKHFNPDELIRGIGGHGLAAVFRGSSEGPVVMFRCELDGLPISEAGQKAYRSKNEGKGHLCGHDGHMVMVAGIAPLVSASKPGRGTVILLFQPAEETGEGAGKVLEDARFRNLDPDYIFALHNLPGFETSSVILRKGVFASASRGLVLELTGASSHAGHPENGKNPALAASLIIQSVLSIPSTSVPLHINTMITPIHVRVGNPAFGTSPGEGVVMFTLRAHDDATLDQVCDTAVERARVIAASQGIEVSHRFTEPFEAVKNDDACVDLIEECARALNMDITYTDHPFPWSEDFGVFTGKYRGALFGLGSGTTHPQLHSEHYDFPDEIIESGTLLFYSLAEELLNQSHD